MSNFSEMLTYLRKRAEMSQKDLAEKLGVSRSTIGMYETGGREPDFETLEAIADTFNVNMDTLLGKPSLTINKILSRPSSNVPSNILPMPKMVKKPRLGAIACGKPILAVEEADEFDLVPEDIICDFTLQCKGDSMIDARICDGDIVYIRSQPEVENGQIAAVRVGDEATLKKVYYNGGRIILRACNPLYADMEFEGERVNEMEVLGLAVGFTSIIRPK